MVKEQARKETGLTSPPPWSLTWMTWPRESTLFVPLYPGGGRPCAAIQFHSATGPFRVRLRQNQAWFDLREAAENLVKIKLLKLLANCSKIIADPNRKWSVFCNKYIKN